jgi:dUTP pyrophosphatase
METPIQLLSNYLTKEEWELLGSKDTGGHLPSYATEDSAGMDLRACFPTDYGVVRIPAHTRLLVPCGIAVAIHRGWEGQIRPRSGLASTFGITVLNSPGTIDSDYRGEIQVCLINHGALPFEIRRGDRIAQLVICPVERITWNKVEALPTTIRGDGGFGSTGTN